MDENWYAPMVASSNPPHLCRTLQRPDINALFTMPIPDLQRRRFEDTEGVLRLMDDRAAELGASWKSGWREFLRMSNILQFAPGAVCVTTLGLREGIYGSLVDVTTEQAGTVADELQGLAANVLDAGAQEILRRIYKSGRVLPEPGYEIADEEGEIAGVAELAWIEQKVCVVTISQTEYAEAIRALGWKVFITEEREETVQSLVDLLPPRKI